MNDPRCKDRSGVYWSWNGNAQQVGTLNRKLNDEGKYEWQVAGAGGAGGEIFENKWSNEVANVEKASKAFDLSLRAVGL